ncbi:MAG: 16S rRNA (cytosine(1402)-N(4))-methyltransferase RsmH [Candidatus Sericytochromatia bacterium]|nr:16S rRNA (cytosine(1402)-N(4))-methyltransferase RsmH [Candidatus Sericytochromatia bacterium]
MSNVFSHQPVLLDPVLHWLAPSPGDVVLDGTVGGAGHACALWRHIAPTGLVVGLDRDPAALAAAGDRLAEEGARHQLHRTTFDRLAELGLPPLDVVLLDIGVSSPQLDRAERGFSFRQAGPLDMRMDPDAPMTAADMLREASEAELARVFFELGEERQGRRVARALVAHREAGGWWDNTATLADFIARIVGRGSGQIHPATRVFQALRIAVNDELGMLRRALPAAVAALKPGGRLGVITFHSLEDRIVKQFFQGEARGCICPPRQPVCTCSHRPSLEVVTRKPVVASDEEARGNPRARSAKLRVARRLTVPARA